VTTPTELDPDRLVQLSTVPSDGHVIDPEFWARVDGETVFVTAVLERTIVFISGSERKLTNRRNCWVDPEFLVMHPLITTWGSRARVAPTGSARPIIESGVDEAVEDEPTIAGWEG